MRNINDRFLSRALTLNPWHFVWITILSSEVITFCLNAVQSMLRWGHVSWELIRIGIVDAFVVSLFVAPIVIYFLKAANERLQHDIDKHRLTEYALKESKDTARNLLDIPMASALLVDREGICLDANETFAGRFGKRVSDIVGRPIWRLFPDDVSERRKAVLKGILREKKQVRFEDERQGIWNDIVVNPILDEQGEVLKMVVFGFDITARKQTEEELRKYHDHLEELVARRTKALELLNQQLRQSQKMEAIGLLAGGIAHDFSNILTAIKGSMYLIQKRLEKDSSIMPYADQVVSSVNKANHLAQGLLAFSSKQMFILRPCDLNDIVRDAARLVAPLIGEHIEFSTVFSDGAPYVMADRNQIEQVLLNLVTNARDAMAGGGRLTMRTGTIKIGEAINKERGYGVTGKYASVTVCDTGTGIDEAIREKIFEPFFTTKGMGKGSGLGLSVAYGIVKQHNGFIDVSSVPREGTAFTVYIPTVEAAMTQPEVRAVPLVEGGKETVLLAEDDADARAVTGDILRQAGYEVLDARDGEDAIAIFIENKDRINLVMLDVMMPRKNGREVYDEIRRAAPGSKCLFISGYTADIIDSHGILEEGLNFISKAALPDEILGKIREVLDT
ncbi:MAG: ATP-binding protein [Acidobacteriota bacterium]